MVGIDPSGLDPRRCFMEFSFTFLRTRERESYRGDRGKAVVVVVRAYSKSLSLSLSLHSNFGKMSRSKQVLNYTTSPQVSDK